MGLLPSRIVDAHIHWHSVEEIDPRIVEMVSKEFPVIRDMVDNPESAEPLLELLDQEGVDKCFIINYVSPDVMGYSFRTNEWVARFCEGNADRLIPVGGILPSDEDNSLEQIRNYLETGAIKMLKVHGPHQLLSPSAYREGMERQRELYELAEELRVPVLFHTGSSIFPRARSRYGDPLLVEDVLIDFPRLDVTIAHGGRPFWMREAEYLMAKFPNLMFDLSGIPPKMIPSWFPRFSRYIDRCVFGSDFPSPGVPGIRKNAETLASLITEQYGATTELLEKVFYTNALKRLR